MQSDGPMIEVCTVPPDVWENLTIEYQNSALEIIARIIYRMHLAEQKSASSLLNNKDLITSKAPLDPSHPKL